MEGNCLAECNELIVDSKTRNILIKQVKQRRLKFYIVMTVHGNEMCVMKAETLITVKE